MLTLRNTEPQSKLLQPLPKAAPAPAGATNNVPLPGARGARARSAASEAARVTDVVWPSPRHNAVLLPKAVRCGALRRRSS